MKKVKLLFYKKPVKKKVAILYLGKIKERSGGPSSYLFNLKSGLRFLKEKDVVFISGPEKKVFFGDNCRKNLENRISKGNANGFDKLAYQFLFIIYEIESKIHYAEQIRRACEYEIVHVHHVADLFYLKILGRYKGRIILTMHTPEPWSSEVIHTLQDRLGVDEKFSIINMYEHLIEKSACKMADEFIFPSRDAEKTYQRFDFYPENKRVSYLITGVPKKNILADKAALREEYGLPQDAFVVLYIGRHNAIKGYDLLIEAQKKLENLGIYVICAGKESKRYKPGKSALWRELGWQNRVEKLYGVCDVVVLPNRQTYFDLAAIEAMQQKKILVASASGGNYTLANGSRGVLLFKNECVEEMISRLQWVKELDNESRDFLEKCNLKYYETCCSLEQFAKHYICILREIKGA